MNASKVLQTVSWAFININGAILTAMENGAEVVSFVHFPFYDFQSVLVNRERVYVHIYIVYDKYEAVHFNFLSLSLSLWGLFRKVFYSIRMNSDSQRCLKGIVVFSIFIKEENMFNLISKINSKSKVCENNFII